MVFRSPYGHDDIAIWQKGPDNSWAAKVEVSMDHRRTELITVREAFIYFVHVYWSSDGSRVGVLTAGSTPVHVAYDLKLHKNIPFTEIRDEVARSIRTAYHLSDAQDPLRWAESPQASDAFFRLHPEIHVFYR